MKFHRISTLLHTILYMHTSSHKWILSLTNIEALLWHGKELLRNTFTWHTHQTITYFSRNYWFKWLITIVLCVHKYLQTDEGVLKERRHVLLFFLSTALNSCVFCPLFKFHFTQQKWQIWKPPDLYFSWHSMCFSVKKQSCDMAIKCHNHFSWPWTKHSFFHFCVLNTHCSEENSPGSEAKTVRHCSSFSFFQTHCRDGPWSENWNGVFLHNIYLYIPFTLYFWTYWEMYCCTSWIPAQSNYHLLNSNGCRF